MSNPNKNAFSSTRGTDANDSYWVAAGWGCDLFGPVTMDKAETLWQAWMNEGSPESSLVQLDTEAQVADYLDRYQTNQG